MSIKNIVNLSAVGGILLLTICAAVIVSPLFWTTTVGVGMFVPEAVSKVE